MAPPPKTYTAGISIESSVNGGDGPGTLGCFAKDKSGNPVLLTCSHVVFPGFTAPPKQGVYTPNYSTCCGGDKIASLVIDPSAFDSETGRYMAGFKIELGPIQIPAPAGGGYTTSKPIYTCTHTDCAVAQIDKGIMFTNTLPTSTGDIVIDGVEEDTDKLLGSTLLKAGNSPATDHYVRMVTANHPNQIIWGTVMWKPATAGDPGAFDLGGEKVTPLVHFGFTDSETKDALAGTLPSLDQFMVLPRPPPKDGVADYTQLYSQAWIKGILGGDSGSVVINSKDQVVGLVVRSQPYTATSLTKVGERGAIEFQYVESIAVCNPIGEVLKQLGITIPGKPFTGTGSYVTPGSAGASISLFDDPQLIAQRSAMTELRIGLVEHRRGRLLVGKVNKHRSEIRRMFVRARAIASAYTSLNGPAWYLHCARSLREPGYTIPSSINGITRDRLADVLLPLIAAHASPALKRDIELYGAWAREALLHVPTMRDAIAAVGAPR